VGHREQKVEKRRRHVKGVACANDGDVTLEGRLEREVQGEVTLVDPGALIHDSFTLEPAELQSDIGRMFHGHVGPVAIPVIVSKYLRIRLFPDLGYVAYTTESASPPHPAREPGARKRDCSPKNLSFILS